MNFKKDFKDNPYNGCRLNVLRIEFFLFWGSQLCYNTLNACKSFKEMI